MASRIPEHTIAEIRDRTDIVSVIGRFVRLKKSGASHKGLCPFHAEKTPSFNVNPGRQSFYCFGCNEKGDVISFLQKMEGKTFIEVVTELAETAGVDLPRRELSPEEERRESEREQLLRLNQLAAEFFKARLWSDEGRQALSYLRSRQLDDAVLETFLMGYAPPGWDALTRYLARNRVPAVLATRLGLCGVRRDREDEGRRGTVSTAAHYDFFRDRVMFPILGAGSKVLGFSGRLLDPEAKERKYINSPESTLYRKSELLYGLPVARQEMRKGDRAILVEGNVDVLAMHQAGYGDTVAPLGTALTEKQVQILRRFVAQVVLAYDGDAAGRTAARKAAELLASEDLVSRVVLFPQGQDPADVVLENPAQVAALLERAPTGPEFLIDEVAQTLGDSVEERVRAAESLRPVLSRIPNPVVRDEYLRRAAAALGLRSEQMRAVQQGRGTPVRPGDRREARRAPVAAPAGQGASTGPVSEEQHAGLSLLALLTAHPRLAPRAAREGAPALLLDGALRELIREALRLQQETGRIDVAALLEQAAESERDRVARYLFSDAYSDENADASRAFSETLAKLRLIQVLRELEGLSSAIRQAEQRGDQAERRQLIQRHQELSRQRQNLVNAVSKGQGVAI